MFTRNAVIFMVLSCTCVVAFEHSTRHSRSRSHKPIQVSVEPEVANFHPWETLKVRCKVKGGITIQEAPFINFYRQFNFSGSNTVMPLSSGSSGITVETSVPAVQRPDNRQRAVAYLTIGPEIFWTLKEGQNMFYCKGSNMLGQSQTALFKVTRVNQLDTGRRRSRTQ